MLKVILLDPGAKAPTVSNPGDLGYDLYALEDVVLNVSPQWVRTGIAVQDTDGRGFIVKDRSSMAGKGIFTHGGVIDAGYRGEIKLCMTSWINFIRIKAGDKVAQLIPIMPSTTPVEIVDALDDSLRGCKGFGSSGT